MLFHWMWVCRLAALQGYFGEDGRIIKKRIRTRWGSVGKSFQSLFDARQSVTTMLGERHLAYPSLPEWTMIGCIATLFERFSTAIAFFSGETYATLSFVPDIICSLISACEELLQSTTVADFGMDTEWHGRYVRLVSEAKQALWSRFEEDIKGNNPAVSCAVAGDPRTKSFSFLKDKGLASQADRQKWLILHLNNVVKELMKPEYEYCIHESIAETAPDPEQDLVVCFELPPSGSRPETAMSRSSDEIRVQLIQSDVSAVLFCNVNVLHDHSCLSELCSAILMLQ